MHARLKKSSAVRLVLMGAAVGGTGLLAGCGTDVQRNRYTSRDDCIADYSDTLCGPDVPLAAAGAALATYYYGPWYRSDVAARVRDPSDPGAGRFFSSSGGGASPPRSPPTIETGTRGGFGAHGRISARGG